MNDNDGWETISTVNGAVSDDGWETIPVTETPEYKSAYTKLKEDGLKLGYSGLSDEQKEMIKAAYPQSLAGKAGVPFEQMTAKMDAQATGPSFAEKAVTGARDWYQKGREGIGTITNLIPGAAAALMGEEHMLGPDGRTAVVDPSKQTMGGRFDEEYKASQEAVKRNEGFQSIVADPMNYVGFGLGAASRLPQLEKLGMLAKASEFLKANPKTLVGARALGGAAEGFGSSYLGRNDVELVPSKSDIASGVIGGMLNPIVRGSAVNPRSMAELKDLETEALNMFPGNKFIRTQARKAGEHVDEQTMHLSDPEKLAILEGVSNQAGGRNPNIDEWIGYKNAKEAEAIDAYMAADAIAKNYHGSEIGNVPLDELYRNMVTGIKKYKGTATSTAKDFLDPKFKGFIEDYGRTIPISDLTSFKAKFNEDIFNPKTPMSEGLTQKRRMAQAAGREITDILNRPTFIDQRDIAELIRNGKMELIDALEAAQVKSYNDLVGKAGRDAYRQTSILEDVFAHQPEATGSQRVGASGQGLFKDLYSSVFPGGRKFYSSTGDAYAEPVMKWKASKPGSTFKRGLVGGLVGGIVPFMSQLPEVPAAIKSTKK